MATYFQGNSEIQGDGLQTLILMNPGYVGYSDTQSQPPGNFVFLNSAAAAAGNSLNSNNLPHAPPSQTQPFVGIPLSAASSQDPHAVHSQNDISALHGFMPRLQYNMYSPVDLTSVREVTRAQQQQGLSLSLSSQTPGYGSFRPDRQVPSQGPPQTISPTRGGDDVRATGGSPSSVSAISNGGVNGMQSVLLSSKYLKVAQELLEEVVNVGEGVKSTNKSAKGTNGQNKAIGGSPAATTGEAPSGGATSTKSGGELTTAERQEIQMKKAKLVNMLDEVEQRYRHYHTQMQIVISWFEQAAGIGSAKTYTALALQTISKQFRCLKDAIMGQIRAASKSLGEEDCLGGGKLEGSRLKFVDNQLRQQRALQQLGMIQHNAWRPQRGLPERSVSVLRAWLFEHFLHPYPKDSDKHMLAKQTGLTRSQVSNWFINARVRLWKPMVEEMYVEETKEQEQNGSEEKVSKSEQNEDSASKSNAGQEKSSATENQKKTYISEQDNLTNQNNPPAFSVSRVSDSPPKLNIRNQSGFTLIGSSEVDGFAQASPKKPRSTELLHSLSCVPSMNMDNEPGEANNEQMFIKFGNERQSRDGFTLMGSPTNFSGGLGSYPIGEIGRFSAEQFQAPYSGNGVSLTLGLPHCENLSMPGTHQSFLPNQNMQLGRGVEIGETNEFGVINTSTSPRSTSMYETVNTRNRKRFAAQLLPDFVA
ncbi:hypothetical protein RJ639_037611 [Escallonia herrerae]|uniref:Homeobox domain-containing protein n=1 Tax=Escallonia herrerae TaxID=1293975 RepID=A0AA88WJZ5_9ASTE|nr:hypothetical protein RJ639_037611 [Escallonia herrerae]